MTNTMRFITKNLNVKIYKTAQQRQILQKALFVYSYKLITGDKVILRYY